MRGLRKRAQHRDCYSIAFLILGWRGYRFRSVPLIRLGIGAAVVGQQIQQIKTLFGAAPIRCGRMASTSGMSASERDRGHRPSSGSDRIRYNATRRAGVYSKGSVLGHVSQAGQAPAVKRGVRDFAGWSGSEPSEIRPKRRRRVEKVENRNPSPRIVRIFADH